MFCILMLMSRFGEAMKNPAIRDALFISLIPLIVGPVLGAWMQDTMFGGWEYGALGGFVAGGAVSATVVLPLVLLIKVIGRHK